MWKLLNECLWRWIQACIILSLYLSAFYQLLMLHSSRYTTNIWIHHSLFVAMTSAPPIWKNLPFFSLFCSSIVKHFETKYIKKHCRKTLEFLRKAIRSGSWTVKYNRYLPQTWGGETYLTLWFRSSEHRWHRQREIKFSSSKKWENRIVLLITHDYSARCIALRSLEGPVGGWIVVCSSSCRWISLSLCDS